MRRKLLVLLMSVLLLPDFRLLHRIFLKGCNFSFEGLHNAVIIYPMKLATFPFFFIFEVCGYPATSTGGKNYSDQ
jgi:hypothetical protein